MLKTGLIVIQNGLYHTLVIILEGVHIVIAQNVYVKDAQAGVHEPTTAETLLYVQRKGPQAAESQFGWRNYG